VPLCMTHCLFQFCPTFLAPPLYLAQKSHSISLSQHVNNQINVQVSCLCTISVPHVQYIYSCRSSCYRGSCMFYIVATTHSHTVLYTALYIVATTQSHCTVHCPVYRSHNTQSHCTVHCPVYIRITQPTTPMPNVCASQGTNCLILIVPAHLCFLVDKLMIPTSLTTILHLFKCNMKFFALNLVLK
jgi:hypothetical protein